MRKCRLHWLPVDGPRVEGDWDEDLRCAQDANQSIQPDKTEPPSLVCEKHAGQLALLLGQANVLAEEMQ